MLRWRRSVYTLRTFWDWFTRASDKAEKLDFKTQREAAEFVRRMYDENGAPNEALKALYRRGRKVRAEGIEPGR